MAEETKVLGLDISMNSSGWAVVGVKEGVVRLIDVGTIKANTKETHGQRLRKQRNAFEEIIEKYEPHFVAREKGFSRHIRSTQVLFKAYGVTEEFFSDYDLVEYAVATIKKNVTGNGHASKEEVEEAIRKRLKLSKDFVFKTDDESDAVGIALTMIKQKNIGGF